MSFPFVLSPYLRPFIEDGHLLVDNGITARRERLDEVQLSVVRALWSEETAQEAMEALVTDGGEPEILGAIEALVARGIVFSDSTSCEEVFDQVLERTTPSIPFVDQIELTNHCPMRCRFCPRGVAGAMQRPRGFMEVELFCRLLDQLHPGQRGYRPLELHHLGESLLHPEVQRCVEEASHRGLPTEMSVNPSLLTPEKAKALVDGGIRRLVISLDGADEKTLRELRGPAASYIEAERNLSELLDIVASKVDPPRIVIQMLDLHRNKDQRELFLERWGATGLPSVTAYIKNLDGDDPDTGQPSSAPLSHLCTYPFRSIVVLWDGRVVPCCRDADARVVLGDLAQMSLMEIWDGEHARRLRSLHKSGSLPEDHLCHGCSWLRSNYAAQSTLRHPDRAQPDPLSW